MTFGGPPSVGGPPPYSAGSRRARGIRISSAAPAQSGSDPDSTPSSATTARASARVSASVRTVSGSSSQPLTCSATCSSSMPGQRAGGGPDTIRISPDSVLVRVTSRRITSNRGRPVGITEA